MCIQKYRPSCSQSVDVWRLRMRVTECADPVVLIINRNEDHVRPRGLRPQVVAADVQTDCEEKSESHQVVLPLLIDFMNRFRDKRNDDSGVRRRMAKKQSFIKSRSFNRGMQCASNTGLP